MMRERLILMSASADGRGMEPWGTLEPMRRRKTRRYLREYAIDRRTVA